MKRWVVRSVVCLILGVVTTVGVAWLGGRLKFYTAFAARQVDIDSLNYIDRSFDTEEAPALTACADVIRWIRAERDAHVPAPGSVYWSNMSVGTASGPFASETVVSFMEVDDFPYSTELPDIELGAIIRRTGWPAFAFSGEYRYSKPEIPRVSSYLLIGSHHVAELHESGMEPPEFHLLSYRPVPLGFMTNAFFYGVIWFGIFFGFGSGRGALRKKRGRCPKCAYDIRSEFDAGCSECGWNRPEDDA